MPNRNAENDEPQFTPFTPRRSTDSRSATASSHRKKQVLPTPALQQPFSWRLASSKQCIEDVLYRLQPDTDEYEYFHSHVARALLSLKDPCADADVLPSLANIIMQELDALVLREIEVPMLTKTDQPYEDNPEPDHFFTTPDDLILLPYHLEFPDNTNVFKLQTRSVKYRTVIHFSMNDYTGRLKLVVKKNTELTEVTVYKNGSPGSYKQILDVGMLGSDISSSTGSSINQPETLLELPGGPLLAVEQTPKASLLHRLCPALRQGSTWGTAINMCAAIMGAGCLSLPQAVNSLGLVPFGLLIVLTTTATHYSIVLLIAAIDATGCKSFEDLAAKIIGPRTGHAVELCIIIFQYGTLVAYTIAIGDVLTPILDVDVIRQHLPWLTRPIVMVLFWLFFMLPLSFVENISSLQITSMIGQVSLLYLVTAVTVHSIIDSAAEPGQTIGAMELWPQRLQPASSASAVIMFAFTCQVNIPSLYQELQPRDVHAMTTVSMRACAICLLSYVLIGVAGYADFGSDVQGNILNNYCVIDSAKSSRVVNPPRIIVPAFGAIVLTVLVAYPINVYPTRYAIEVMCYPTTWRARIDPGVYVDGRGGDSVTVRSKWSRLRHILLTLGISLVSLGTALVAKNIDTVFSLMGGTCSAFVCYIIPSAVSRRLGERVPQNRTCLGRMYVISLGMFGLTVGALSTTTTLMSMIEGDGNDSFDPCNMTWSKSSSSFSGVGMQELLH